MSDITEEQRGLLWQAIVDVRDAHPRNRQDAPTDDILDALSPVLAQMKREWQAEALREAAEARSEWQAAMYAEDERHFATGSMHGAGVDVCADVVEDWLRDRAEASGQEGERLRAQPESVECCASGRCEVCSPGYRWAGDR